MIHSVSANQPGFRTVTFVEGLNVVVAERTQTASEGDTRNGLGKSTLIDIIDFCLGGSAEKGKKLNIEALKDWAFTMEATLGGNRVSVTRTVENPGRFEVVGPTMGWPLQPDVDEETGKSSYSELNWRTLLGQLLFGLRAQDSEEKHKPSYRSLISYFVRTKSGAYLDPFKYVPQQKGIVSRVNVAFLLGLSWENVSRVQVLEDREQGLGALQSVSAFGLPTVGELEAQRVQLQQKAADMTAAVDSFLVHPQYKEIQEEADRLTRELHDLANANVVDRRKLAQYSASITDEAPPDTASLEKLYESSGVLLGDAVRRTLADATMFHKQVISNRREFLETEIERIESVMADRESKIQALTEKRAASLEILRTHGALQEVTKLQDRNVRTQTELNRVTSLIEELKEASTNKRKAKQQKAEAIKVMELDHEERRAIWEKAIRLFSDNSKALYDTPGKLVIDINDTGYLFRVEIERSGSEGIDKMKIFCFDLALLQIRLEKPGQIRFLIHDTLMYDAVDPRQRAKALERADAITRAASAQYICTINSDMVPRDDFSKTFNFERCVRLTLTDSSPSGSLLGMRFG